MVKISIQAAHEQVNPTDLLHDVIYMDQNGIERCWSSDHYMPWWNTGASGGAAWRWIGAALARTSKIKIGTVVLIRLSRVFLGIGRRESLNEVTSGQSWPSNQEKYRQIKEAIILIKKLWNDDWVNFYGDYYSVKDSKLYTKPKNTYSNVYCRIRKAIRNACWRARKWICHHRTKCR